MNDSNTRADAKAEAARAKALRPWYKKKRFIIPLVIFGLFVIGSLTSGGDDGGGSNTANDSDDENLAVESESENEDTAGLNQAVRDGKFEFTVTGVECGETTVGNQFLNKTAQGQFCFVSLHVKNIGQEAQTLFGDNMKLFDAQGRQYSSDSEAAIYADETKSFLEEINPGNELDGKVIFDVPKDVQPTKVELHDSAFSGGVTVNLR